MGLITAVAVCLVILAVIGGGTTAFFSSVSSGVEKVSSFVENSPVLKNITDEGKEFVKEQGGKLANEVFAILPIDAYATKEGKGLKVDLTVLSSYLYQPAEIDTFQDGEFLYTENIENIPMGERTFELKYPKNTISEGPFEICVWLVNDQVESCGNGYNNEGKQPESVYVELLGAGVAAPDESSSSSSASSSSSDSENTNENENENANTQAQSTTIINCPPEATCNIEK